MVKEKGDNKIMINKNVTFKSIHVVLIVAICVCGAAIALVIQSKQSVDDAAIFEEENIPSESTTSMPLLANDVINN